MPSRNETMRAFERLRLATPICDDASLVKLEEDERTTKVAMEARYIPPRRWRDRTPGRYPWPALTAAVVIVVALILLVLIVGLHG